LKNYYNRLSKAFKIVCFLVVVLHSNYLVAQKDLYTFKVIPLGVYGGLDESNLSSYMLTTVNSNNYVCLDAGSLHDGIAKAIQQKNLTGNVDYVLKNDIKGYLISHPHLDHVAGLIINSPDDSSKNIYALPFCINTMEEKYFTWQSWANFADEGEKPLLKKYHYVHLSPDSETMLSNTKMFVRPFELSHSNPYKSTAFLVRCDSSYILYLGDTGADSIEKLNKLHALWSYIAPIIKRNELKAIFIEVSYPDEQSTNKLFGHLKPSLLFDEMQTLSLLCGELNLKKIPLVITHIKPSGNNEQLIKKELKQNNLQHLTLIFPQQGKTIRF
jgi:cAMP phosphodiesterase